MHTEKAYWLPAHVRACSTATGTVLLDLQRNRYFGVGRNETLALRSLGSDTQWRTLAALVGGDLGPRFLPMGSLAGLLWIEMARRRPEVFETRLAYFIKMTAQNKTYGMVQ